MNNTRIIYRNFIAKKYTEHIRIVINNSTERHNHCKYLDAVKKQADFSLGGATAKLNFKHKLMFLFSIKYCSSSQISCETQS